ncbi:MAG: acetate kinase [Phormidesmis sp.]
MNILVLNAGSSSHKGHLYALGDSRPQDLADPIEPLWQAQIDWQQSPPLLIATGAGKTVRVDLDSNDRAEAVIRMLNTLHQGKAAVLSKLGEIDAVGHRVVHGGSDYQKSVWVDEGVKGAIANLIPLAPSHNRANLEGIQIIEQLLGNIPQYAVFDTAFHSTIPEVAALYPVPQHWTSQGIRRYGFHGISHQYCAHRAAQLLDSPSDLRLVTAHLGNGCSLAAVCNGRCIDTTMGFTPMEGLMMGTRSGSIDPGILIYLMREKGYTYEQLDHQLNKESGLKAVSGLSGNMRELKPAIDEGSAQAKLAVDMYMHRLSASIAAMAASLKGLDAIVFTGGVGANTPLVRNGVCDSLAFLDIDLFEKGELKGERDRLISSKKSKVSVLVIHTQEEWQIAKEYWQLSRSN